VCGRQTKLEANEVDQVGSTKQHLCLCGEVQEASNYLQAESAVEGGGKLWKDADFKTLKMDVFCKDIWELLDVLHARGPERIFWC
jgi:hypothetical protein